MSNKTPMMRQYDAAKEACGDALLLFRMGDFYELFHDDAKVAAKELGLTLTSRDKNNPIPMAGFPHHQLDTYLAKLIQSGFRAAVCEQVEDPKTAKGLVKREVTQLVTPGTVTDLALMDPAECNYLVALVPQSPKKRKRRAADGEGRKGEQSQDVVGLAWAEIASGRFYVTSARRDSVADLLARLSASEILVSENCEFELPENEVMVTRRPPWSFSFDTAERTLKDQFKVASLDGFGIDRMDDSVICAAGAVIEYLKETHKGSLEHIDRVLPYRQSVYVEIDSASWRSLEVTRTLRGGSREGSLLGVIDRCTTPMGSRMLAEWLANPLTGREEIEARHDAVGEIVGNSSLRSGLISGMGEIYDMQRLIARVVTARTSPRDMQAICKTLSAVPVAKSQLSSAKCDLLKRLQADLDPCNELQTELAGALIDRCPPIARDGGFIREGYDKELDSLRELATGGKQWIANYQAKICEETGIKGMKVGFNKVFGYYLEVTNANKDRVPEAFIRKQTLKNAERYITPELKEYEEKVLSAENDALAREMLLFDQLRELVRVHTSRLKANSHILATLDALAGLATLAVEQSYCRPEMTDQQELEIVDGRHPVLDIIQPLGAFVPNDTQLGSGHGVLHLITGPNMAGKSTYIRQVALLTLMAQAGSFVPAASAKIGVVDKIFARVGASDELSKGQSTFMVEMTETARILNTASARSLVILDEIGRGTSTYDGVSLAWSIVEYMHDRIGCSCLFATHYHELTALEETLEGVRNYNVSVQEWDEKIVFLHKIVSGSADKSYGIHVAKLAGVPVSVNDRAAQILEKLEQGSDVEANRDAIMTPTEHPRRDQSGRIQLTLFGPVHHPLVDKVKALDPNRMSPMDALEMLHSWKRELEDDADDAGSNGTESEDQDSGEEKSEPQATA
ncbi:MAG: DNA mismatch repair protein MutS [Planctomycetota bacterium]